MSSGVPVHDIEAERTVVAVSVLDADARSESARILRPEDFYDPKCRAIWEGLAALEEADRPADMVNLAAWARENQRALTSSDVVEICDTTSATGNYLAHAKRVAQLAAQRRLGQACAFVAGEARQHQPDFEAWRAKAEARLAEAAEGAEAGRETQTSMAEAVAEILARRHSDEPIVRGIPTGIFGLDVRIGGLRPGKITVVGARPGVGKTAFAMQVARGAAGLGHGTAFISLEQTHDEIATRALVQVSQVSSERLRSGAIGPEVWNALEHAGPELTRLPLIIDDQDEHSVASLRRAILRARRRLQSERGVPLELVVIDYLQLVGCEERQGESRATSLGRVSRAIRQMAKRYGFAVLLLSQLNRASEARPDKRPRMADLRESGEIEQDAYAILLFHRPEDAQGLCEIIVAKCRDAGSAGTVEARYDGPTLTFSDPRAPAPVNEYEPDPLFGSN